MGQNNLGFVMSRPAVRDAHVAASPMCILCCLFKSAIRLPRVRGAWVEPLAVAVLRLTARVLQIAGTLTPDGYLMLATQNRPALGQNDTPAPSTGQVCRELQESAWLGWTLMVLARRRS